MRREPSEPLPVETLKAHPDPSVKKLLEFGVVELFLDWISETLASPKLANKRDKLMRTGAAERHIFHGITFTSPEQVYFGLTLGEQGLPALAPTLPREITHLWLWNIEGGDRCAVWFPERGWLDAMDNWATE